jgi:penicillin-binding protein 1C
VTLAVVALTIAVALQPLPPALRGAPAESTLRVLDRGGRLLGEYRPDQGQRAGSVRLEQLPEHVVAAVLAAEDARFYRHAGVDPVAMFRAALQAAWHRRIVSGASTITQQLARNVTKRPPGLGGKLREMIIALRIERELDKTRILEEYLNRVDYAPQVRGLDAASRVFFDKPAARLDLAEAALLVGLPRGPSLYNPARGTERAERRRNRVLERMRAAGLASEAAVAQALRQPVRLQTLPRRGGAEHFVRALGAGQLLPDWPRGQVREARTTLDAALQAEVQGLALQTVKRLEAEDATAAAVLVVDNATRHVLAYVGSPDFWSVPHQGQNDGVRARRQPGSTLKPFVYAAAMDALGYTAATLLPDIELHLPTAQGDYAPRNYDGRFHGPVRLREALANSLNVPAVFTAQRVGPDRVLSLLRTVGFHSLDRDAAHYGAALALGDGEVTLAELAAAYATLATEGRYAPLRFVLSARDAGGRELPMPSEPPEVHDRTGDATGTTATGAAGAAPSAVLPPTTARLLTDILADPHARSASFGRGSVLDLPFAAAVKTGTSKGYRDNWAVGFTREVTVAVWVGNFDGRPMRNSSGVTGAGPLFRDVLLAAMEGRTPAPLRTAHDLVPVEVCALSGELPSEHCTHRVRELFPAGRTPRASCAFHERVLVARASQRLATPRCADAEWRVFERYPETFQAWAQRAGRPLAPVEFDARCPGAAPDALPPGARPEVAYPFAGAHFTVDPGLTPERQNLLFRARGVAQGLGVTFLLDGRPLSPQGPHEILWRLQRGQHRLEVEAGGGRSAPVHFTVE